MDVDVTEDQEGPDILADDFECTQTGPITSVVIWASWYHDQLPQQPAGVDNPSWVSFDLSFHKDIPADQNPLWLDGF